jgi:hypothetical protein
MNHLPPSPEILVEPEKSFLGCLYAYGWQISNSTPEITKHGAKIYRFDVIDPYQDAEYDTVVAEVEQVMALVGDVGEARRVSDSIDWNNPATQKIIEILGEEIKVWLQLPTSA